MRLYNTLIFALLLFSCAAVGYNTAKLESFHKALAKENKKASIYDGFQSRAFFKVIYRSTEVRERYVEAIAEMESLTESEREALRKKEMEEDSKYFDFCVVLSTTEFKVNDLDSKNSVWKVFLESPDGTREYPVEIKEIKADSRVKLLYPGVSRFGKFYHIRFERGAIKSIEGTNLVFSSALGRSVFKY
jgi:hypothetical protein